jgi:hypothetical protein
MQGDCYLYLSIIWMHPARDECCSAAVRKYDILDAERQRPLRVGAAFAV